MCDKLPVGLGFGGTIGRSRSAGTLAAMGLGRVGRDGIRGATPAPATVAIWGRVIHVCQNSGRVQVRRIQA